MKIILITQDEPFYLGKHIGYLFANLHSWAEVSGVVVLDASPFGKPNSFLDRIMTTYKVFGGMFFLRFTLKFIYAKLIDSKYQIKNVLSEYKIPQIELPRPNINAKKSLEVFKALKPDLIISISANQIFKKNILTLPSHGCLNLHTALLPNYKGLMPTFWAMKNNEKEIGVSVFIMDEGIDTGEIIVQKINPIEPYESLETLISRTKKIGMDAIIESISLINSGDYKSTRFPPNSGSYYSFPTKQDVKEFINAGKRFW